MNISVSTKKIVILADFPFFWPGYYFIQHSRSEFVQQKQGEKIGSPYKIIWKERRGRGHIGGCLPTSFFQQSISRIAMEILDRDLVDPSRLLPHPPWFVTGPCLDFAHLETSQYKNNPTAWKLTSRTAPLRPCEEKKKRNETVPISGGGCMISTHTDGSHGLDRERHLQAALKAFHANKSILVYVTRAVHFTRISMSRWRQTFRWRCWT